MSRILFILVEGNDDERFFTRVVKPRLERTYCSVKTWKYAQEPLDRVRGIARSAESMRADVIYVRDFDGATCISAKKGEIEATLGECIPSESVVIVVEEIESWYLAGVDQADRDRLGFSGLRGSTDCLTKETFDDLRPKNVPRTSVMHELLDNYDIRIGKASNTSFRYFVRKWLGAADRG